MSFAPLLPKFRQRRSVTRRDQQSGNPVLNDLSAAGHVRPYKSATACGRFEQDSRKALAIRGQTNDARTGIRRVHVSLMAPPLHAPVSLLLYKPRLGYGRGILCVESADVKTCGKDGVCSSSSKACS